MKKTKPLRSLRLCGKLLLLTTENAEKTVFLLSADWPESKKLQPFGQRYNVLHQSGIVSSDSRTNYLVARAVNIHLHYIPDLSRHNVS